MKPKTPAPSMFQKATATKHMRGHLRLAIHFARCCRRQCSQASWPSTTRGTTSSALNDAPTAITGVVVPLKYRWWKVPGTPPSMKSEAEARLAAVAMRGDTRPSVEKMGPRAVEEARTVERADGHHRRCQQRQQVLVAAGGAQRRHDAAQHEHQPEGDAGELADLPQ